MRSRVVLVAAVGMLVCLAVVLALRNVEVRVDERDLDGSTGAVGCVVAPWDAVVNDERGAPGGEHDVAWGEAVGAACARENEQRFAAAGISALAGAALAVVAARRRPWGSGRPAAAHGSAA